MVSPLESAEGLGGLIGSKANLLAATYRGIGLCGPYTGTFFGVRVLYLLDLSGCYAGVPLRGGPIGLRAWHATIVSANQGFSRSLCTVEGLCS